MDCTTQFINQEMENIKRLRKADVQDICLLTSSRGIYQKGLSMSEKSIRICPSDDLHPIDLRFDTNLVISED